MKKKQQASESEMSEKEFLDNYDPSVFQRPSAAVDNVILTLLDDELHVLLVKREHHPAKEAWSLVGGFIDIDLDQDLEATARRKLQEKTGVKTPYLEQVYTVGTKGRDPRGWSLTAVYLALVPHHKVNLEAGPGAIDIKWEKIKGSGVGKKLAFDHSSILKECLIRLRSKAVYTSLPVHLMPPEFTLSELQSVYELVLDSKMDHKSFRRRMLGADILQETGKEKKTARRPAMLYKLKNSKSTFFFTRNIKGQQS